MSLADKLSDEDLVLFVREKDKEAYGFIIDRYEKRIFYYINRLINNPEEARNLTQQTFVNAYVNIYSFDKNKKFSSWVYRIAHNLAVNWLKRKKASISLSQNEVIASKLASEIDVFEEAAGNEFNDKINSLLTELPVKFKEPFVLRYFEKKSYDEISDILRKPKSTIGTLLQRAKEILKKELEKIYGQRN